MIINGTLIFFVVMLNAAATIVLKKASGHLGVKSLLSLETLTHQPLLLTLALACGLYGMALIASMVALSRMDISFFNPFMALTFIITAIAGMVLFNEILSPLRIMGILVIMAGVVMVARSSSSL